MNNIAFLATLLSVLIMPITSHAGELKIYKDGDVELEGYWAPSQCESTTPAPVVLVIHQWMGLTDYEKGRTDKLAKECYNAFAVDMYGKGIRPANIDEAGKQATLYKSDAALARRRITAALDFVKTQSNVDAGKIAAIGYCFGGTMALELARSGADIKAVIPFHGGLATPAPLTEPGVIKASVQIHHGADDPFVKPEEVNTFIAEMNTAKADWEFTSYAGAVHSFTQKEIDAAGIPGAGLSQQAGAPDRAACARWHH